jgi:hypothetical protein
VVRPALVTDPDHTLKEFGLVAIEEAGRSEQLCSALRIRGALSVTRAEFDKGVLEARSQLPIAGLEPAIGEAVDCLSVVARRNGQLSFA